MFPPRPLPEGTLVILKSGGPLMTTEKGDGKNLVSCLWFDGLVVTRDVFHQDALGVVALPPSHEDEIQFNKAMNAAAVKREAAAALREAESMLRDEHDHEAS